MYGNFLGATVVGSYPHLIDWSTAKPCPTSCPGCARPYSGG